MTTPPLDPHQHFYEVEELAQLSLAELQALWDNVQTEDQAYLVRVFEREASKRQIVEDLDESQMAHYFLQQYQTLGFVPAGDVWLKIPPDIREQYKRGVVDAPDESATTSTTTSFPRWLMLLAIPFVCLMVFALMRMARWGKRKRRRDPLGNQYTHVHRHAQPHTDTHSVTHANTLCLVGF
jgi:hypothetical protein